MSSLPNTHTSTFPTVPESLSTGGHGMRDHYAEQEHTAQRRAPHSLQDLTPYLGLRARLSQIWLNRWTILLLLILARTLIGIGSLKHDIDSAKTQALSACSSVESMGSAMASLPHYMSQGTNELAARGVEKAVDALESMLFMTITGVEEIFVFVVNMMYGTYECLITFAIDGAAEAAVALMQDATDFLNKTLGDIGGTITKDADAFTGDLNDFLKNFNSVGNFLTGSSGQAPSLNLDGDVSKLSNLQLPTDITDQLNKLNGSVPDFSQVRNLTNTVLREPFELVKQAINDTLGPFAFDRSVFPVPARQQLTFCSADDGIDSFFDGLYDVADTARKVFIAVLLLAAVLACIPMTIQELRRWRTMQQRAVLVSQKSLDPMDVIYIASRPYTAGAGLKLANNFASTKRQILMRWFIAYITSTPALLVLALAVAGLFSALCQYVLLQALQKEVPAISNAVGAFAGKVVDALESASAEWANGTNAAIVAENVKINNEVFGWVNTSTNALNDTLTAFINDTTGLLNDTFGGTVLYEPLFGVFECLIGLKVASIEQGLTWVSDNAHIDFPLFPNDTFSLGAAQAIASDNSQTGTSNDSFIADPDSDATDKVTAAVLDLTNSLADGIRTEALISTAVLMVYVAVVLLGLARVVYQLSRRDRLRAEGGATYAGDIEGLGNTRLATPIASSFARSNIPQQESGFRPASEAPAYEEKFSAFRSPMPPAAANTSEPWDRAEDTKVGYAGLREPADRRGGKGGKSMYGVVEDEKR